jgi:hypothetical protein
MRICKTIRDLLDLCADYNVKMELTDGPEIYFQFLETKEETPKSMPYIRQDPPHQVLSSRRCADTIRALFSHTDFRRKTTVADQVGLFALNCKDYGKLKARKKANQPLMLVCESHIKASKLFHDLSKTNDFEG